MQSSNNATPKSVLNSPFGFIAINGQYIPWKRFEVNNSRYSAASTFKVSIPVSTLPNSLTLNDLITNSPLTIQINAGIPVNGLSKSISPSVLPMLILGDADDVLFEPDKTLVTISGRDYISRFLDNKLNQLNNSVGQQVLSNLNSAISSNVITLICNNRGLVPNVTPTTQPIGTYLQNSPSLLTSQITEWDLMTFLAKQEGFDIFVEGMNLYFQPNQTTTPYKITLTIPYFTSPTSIPTSNAQQIQLTRNMRLAKNVIVQVSSWNVYDKVAYNSTATLLHSAVSVASNASPLIYNYRFPNLSKDQCTLKANSLLAAISQHEMQLNVQMPADTSLKVQSPIQVTGTNSAYDQIYYINNIMREMDFSGGFKMSIEAKNTPPVTIQLT